MAQRADQLNWWCEGLVSWERLAVQAMDYAQTISERHHDVVQVSIRLTFDNARSALSIRDAKSLADHMANQLRTIKQLSEHLKADTDEMTAAHEAFVEQTQELARETVRERAARADAAAEEGVQTAATIDHALASTLTR